MLPALEVRWVPTGTTRLHTYFRLFTDTALWGNTAYTATALSLVDDLRSSELRGNSFARHDHVRIG